MAEKQKTNHPVPEEGTKEPLNKPVGTAAATHPKDDGVTYTHDGKPPVTHAQQLEDFGKSPDEIAKRQAERNREAGDSLAGSPKKFIANNRTAVPEDTVGGIADAERVEAVRKGKVKPLGGHFNKASLVGEQQNADVDNDQPTIKRDKRRAADKAKATKGAKANTAGINSTANFNKRTNPPSTTKQKAAAPRKRARASK
jgi:hypothetical protein